LRSEALSFTVQVSGVQERVDSSLSPEENARLNAVLKARAVSKRVPDAIVLGADTLVFLDGRYFGKPSDEADAIGMLQSLSGTRHSVLTGIALVDGLEGIELSDCERTYVTMKNVEPSAIKRYVESGKGHSKAGAFAIQEIGDEFVEKVEGSFTNVVGLPMERLKLLFERYLETRGEKKP
jgi:septum formation protein